MLRVDTIRRVICTACGWSKTLSKDEEEPRDCPQCGENHMPKYTLPKLHNPRVQKQCKIMITGWGKRLSMLIDV